MKDIENREALDLFVRAFYKELLADDRIAYVFTDIAKVDLEAHFPVLVTFWSQLLFDTGGYTRNLTKIHLDLNEQSHLSPELFQIWLDHFAKTAHALFEGPKTEAMLQQAQLLSVIMQSKIQKNT